MCMCVYMSVNSGDLWIFQTFPILSINYHSKKRGLYNLQKQAQDHTRSQTKTEYQKEQLWRSRYRKPFQLGGCRLLHPTVLWLVLSMLGLAHQRLEDNKDADKKCYIRVKLSYFFFFRNMQSCAFIIQINRDVKKTINHKISIVKNLL